MNQPSGMSSEPAPQRSVAAVVRPALLDDLDVVVELRLEFLAGLRGVPVGAFAPEFAARTRSFVANGHRTGRFVTWLAEDKAMRAVGVVSMLVRDALPSPHDHCDQEGYVVNMYVVPAFRRCGLATALLSACIEEGRRRRLRQVVLEATDDGLALYLGAGFQRNPRHLVFRLEPPTGGASQLGAD